MGMWHSIRLTSFVILLSLPFFTILLSSSGVFHVLLICLSPLDYMSRTSGQFLICFRKQCPSIPKRPPLYLKRECGHLKKQMNIQTGSQIFSRHRDTRKAMWQPFSWRTVLSLFASGLDYPNLVQLQHLSTPICEWIHFFTVYLQLLLEL